MSSVGLEELVAWKIHFPLEYGTIAFWLFAPRRSFPRFSCTSTTAGQFALLTECGSWLSSTFWRNVAPVPELTCGKKRWICPEPPPGSWFQLVIVQL